MNHLKNYVCSSAVFLPTILSTACIADMDGFVANGRQCSKVTTDGRDCTGREPPFQVCTPCESEYPWEERVGVSLSDITRYEIPVDTDETSGESIKNEGYFIRADPDGDGVPSDVTVVYTHGNFAGIEHYLNRIARLHEMGVNVYAVSYRGFGKSTDLNEPSEVELFADARVMRSFLDDVVLPEQIPPEAIATHKVFHYGYSMGALTIMEMTLNKPACGLILEAPWPSVQFFADDSTFAGIPASFLTTGTYDNVSKISQVASPIFLLHGAQDDFLRIEFSDEMARIAQEAGRDITYRPVPDAGHGNGTDSRGNPDIPSALDLTDLGYDGNILSFIQSNREAGSCP